MDFLSLVVGDAVDQREFAKMAPTSSDVSTPAQKRKKERRLANIGLVGVGAAGVAGAHATYLTAQKHGPAFHPKNFKTPTHVQDVLPGMEKYGKVSNPRKAAIGAAAVGAGWLGLHAAELGSDTLAARALNRQRKANTDKKKEVKKIFDDIVDARKQGVITTSQALDLIEKANLPWDVSLGRGIVRGMGRAGKEQTANLADKGYRALPSVKRQRRMMLAQHQATMAARGPRNLVRLAAGTGVVVGGTIGYKKGKKVNDPVIKNDQVDYGFVGEISKINEDKRLVFGWCSLSEIDGEPVVDLQDDWAPIDEIEKSAYAYVVESRKGGDMHERDGDGPKHVSDLVESFIATPEKLQKMGLSEEASKTVPSGWWIGFKVQDDAQWDLVKNNERSGFSIHGKGSRVSKILNA